MKHTLLLVSLLLSVGAPSLADVAETGGQQPATPKVEEAAGEQPEAPKTKEGAKFISGMSILGNQEAPKSLVIVPWKSSVLGNSLGIATMLDDSKQPVDRDVFLRALSYYEIRSETKP